VDNFVGNRAWAARKTTSGLRCDKTMKFSAEISLIKSMSYNDFSAFPGHPLQCAELVLTSPLCVKHFFNPACGFFHV
jgi:hypothetical protein